VVVAHSRPLPPVVMRGCRDETNQGRTRIEVWVKRPSLAWLNEQAKREGEVPQCPGAGPARRGDHR
jgi:hypothetical protein